MVVGLVEIKSNPESLQSSRRDGEKREPTKHKVETMRTLTEPGSAMVPGGMEEYLPNGGQGGSQDRATRAGP